MQWIEMLGSVAPSKFRFIAGGRSDRRFSFEDYTYRATFLQSQTNPTPPAGGSARIALVPSTAPPQSRLIIPQPISPLRPGQQPPSVPELRCISFDTNGRGVPLAELLSSPAEALQQKIPDFRDTTILEILLTHIQIKVYWPGYEHLNFTHEVYLSESGAGGVSCKGELAIEAAKAYDAFFKQAAQCNSIRGHLSFAITPAPDGPFSLGNLALVSINNVHDGVFRACVEIIRGPALELSNPYRADTSPGPPVSHRRAMGADAGSDCVDASGPGGGTATCGHTRQLQWFGPPF
ncbi:hypothetical protein L226DRAFT_569021 [Lentinus tigrinus ALCF2SS1-7]|uniref:uncharacterized protein n=1 Tax=Lentinus tigrinus ALCF2SS1-7 TaxID=1328758 RepID=UPI0011660578|nr:hypothetical protein L226DRAFT_569021 [Lentinus tigrinus ALCF2SS1-7]